MEIVYKQVSELVPYANNPRKNDGAVEAEYKERQKILYGVTEETEIKLTKQKTSYGEIKEKEEMENDIN